MISNLIRKGTKLFTKNFTPGKTVYGESLFRFDDGEYRGWNPERSKLAAALLKGSKSINLVEGNIVLYLGASSGTTVSHVSDIIGRNGFVFALDFAPRVMRDLVFLSEDRKNIIPLLADASHPEDYKDKVYSPVDFLYQDVAQKNQVQIFVKNIDIFLKKGGIACLALKARSINVAASPQKIFNEVRDELRNWKSITLLEQINLEPFELDHCMFVVEKK